MNKNLIILSGSTDPAFEKHSKRYDLVIDQAKKHEYQEIRFLKWTGQRSSGKKGLFSMQNAMVDAVSEIEKIIELKQEFDIIAFSWGCGVALRSIQLLHKKLNLLDRVVLWGVSPFWKEYEAFEVNKHNSIVDAYYYSGCIVDDNYLKYQIPIEYLIRSYNSEQILKVGAGCTSGDYSFLKYIESIVDNEKITFHYLENTDHVVAKFDHNYIEFLFN